MGYVPQSTADMGPFSVEVRSESFYLKGERLDDAAQQAQGKARHGIYLYPDPSPDGRQGNVEMLLEDIPRIRAALDLVESVASGQNPEKNLAWISFSGSSDDLIEISGAPGCDPFDPEALEGEWNHSTLQGLSATMGSWDVVHEQQRLRVTAVYDGCWSFAVGICDEGERLPYWPVRLEQSPYNDYSVALVLEVPKGTRIQEVKR